MKRDKEQEYIYSLIKQLTKEQKDELIRYLRNVLGIEVGNEKQI